MNKKKLLMFGLPLLCLVIVSAGIIYLTSVDVTFGVGEPLEVEDSPLNFSGYAGECISKTIHIGNKANGIIPIQLFWNELSNMAGSTYTTDMPKLDNVAIGGSDISIELCYNSDSIVGDVSGEVIVVRGNGNNAIASFTQKDLTTWEHQGDTVSIIYSVSGETFNVAGIPEEYTLIYYPNTAGDVFATNVANAIALTEGSNDIESLPISLDDGDNYCTNGFNPDATVCVGAKLWLIPGTSENAMNDLSTWTNAENYLFETDLITYTKQ